jgi:hypothetical protein
MISQNGLFFAASMRFDFNLGGCWVERRRSLKVKEKIKVKIAFYGLLLRRWILWNYYF